MSPYIIGILGMVIGGLGMLAIQRVLLPQQEALWWAGDSQAEDRAQPPAEPMRMPSSDQGSDVDVNVNVTRSKASIDVFVMIKTTPNARMRRKVMRDTYLAVVNTMAADTIAYRFVSEAPSSPSETKDLADEMARHHDLVLMSSKADKQVRQIGEKMLWGMGWVLDHFEIRHFVIADDDAYINPDKLIEDSKSWASSRFYLGHHMRGQNVIHFEKTKNGRYGERNFPIDTFPPYASGVFLVLSADLLGAFARAPAKLRTMTNDDAQVGVVLLPYDVEYATRKGIMPWGHQKKDTKCIPAADIYVIHATPTYWPSEQKWADDIHACHNKLQRRDCVVGFT